MAHLLHFNNSGPCVLFYFEEALSAHEVFPYVVIFDLIFYYNFSLDYLKEPYYLKRS